MLCSTGIVMERELADDFRVVSELRTHECVAMAAAMLQKVDAGAWTSAAAGSQGFFEKRLAAL